MFNALQQGVVEQPQTAKQRPADQDGSRIDGTPQVELVLGDGVGGGFLVGGLADHAGKGFRHMLAAPGHMAHLATGQPEAHQQTGQQHDNKQAGKQVQVTDIEELGIHARKCNGRQAGGAYQTVGGVCAGWRRFRSALPILPAEIAPACETIRG